MGEPGARVVEAEGEGQVAAARERGDVAAGRVGRLQGRGAVRVGVGALRDDPEVVPVEVDWVG